MSGFFNPDNAFFTFMGKLFDLIVLDLVWLVLYVPFAVFFVLYGNTGAIIFLVLAAVSLIVFIPSMIAMYYAVVKSLFHSRSYPVKEFFRSFKANFRQGAVASLIFVAVGSLLGFDLWYAYDLIMKQDSRGVGYLVGFLVIIFLVSGIFIYFCPLVSRFTMDLKSAFKMSFGLSLRHFWCTILSFILWTVIVLLTLYTRGFAIILGIGIGTVLGGAMMEKVLRKYVERSIGENGDSTPNEDGEGPKKDEWYLE